MKINTNDLTNALATLGNGISKKSTAPVVTQMVELSTKDGALYGYTSDEVNYIKIKIADTTEELLAVVDYNTLFSLIKATRSEEIELKSDSKALNVKSPDLKCKLPILVDSVGNIVSISKFWDTIKQPTDYKTVDFSDLKNYMSIIRSIIKEDFVIPCYSFVYFNKDKIMVTDTDNVVEIDRAYFDKDILLNINTVDFLSKMSEVDTYISDEQLFIHTNNIDFISVLMDKSEYQFSDMDELFTADIDYSTTISGESLSTAINMSKLFGFTAVQLNFGDKGVFFNIPQNDFNYRLSETPTNDYSYAINTELASKLLINKQDLEVSYGLAELIKVSVDGVQGIFSIGL